MMNIKIKLTKKSKDLIDIFGILIKYFEKNELVSTNELTYFINNYHKLFPKENYFCYKIEVNNEIIGTLLGVNLKEFIVIDYFAIEKKYRCLTRYIINELFNIVNTNKPIVVEASTNTLCRFYQMIGFKKFPQPYVYPKCNINLYSKTITFEKFPSNLLFLYNDDINFFDTINIIYFTHYQRWHSIYSDRYTIPYQKFLLNLL